MVVIAVILALMVGYCVGYAVAAVLIYKRLKSWHGTRFFLSRDINRIITAGRREPISPVQ